MICIFETLCFFMSLKTFGGSVVKNPPANAGDACSIPGQEDPLEEEMATHSSILACVIPWTELEGYSPWGCKRVGHNLVTS